MAKYGKKLPPAVSSSIESLRVINRADAEEIHEKIVKYGTTVYFKSQNQEDQIKEIIERSKRDMLVLVRELGQGRKFDQLVRSELGDLDERQRFAYLLVCLTDRNQIPLPIDLFTYAFESVFPEHDASAVVATVGRLIERGANRRTIRTRHSIIAQHVVEQKNSVVDKGEIEKAVRALLVAFSNFQIPIIVHHSNTGHARTFKTIVNRRFLAEVLGINLALQVYRDFEKTFERDGFFWQQYGLCLSQAKEYEAAIDTLRHALAIHDHFMIRHSLGATCLSACIHLGPKKLLRNEFIPLREEGRQLLRDLHEEVGYKDDISISALVELDIEVSRRHDSADAFRILGESYHRELAFYIRDHPEMADAKRAYEKLNDVLIRSSAIGEPDYDSLTDIDPAS